MTDVIDMAQEFDALNLKQSLEVQQRKAANTPHPRAVGSCLNPECCEDFGDDRVRLYCGPACAERHDRILKSKTR